MKVPVNIKIDKEFRSLIPPLTPEELSGLEDDIMKDGIRDSLVVWSTGNVLLDGHNRMDICERRGLGYSTHEVDLPDRDAAKLWIIRNQFSRRNLTRFQRAELALVAKPLIEAQAKERQRAGGKAKVPQISAEAKETRDELAGLAGCSHDTIRKVETILERGMPVLVEEVRNGEISISDAFRQIRHKERLIENRIEIAERKPESLDGKYDVIVADPPWAYTTRNEDETHRGVCPYPPMTTEEICAVDVPSIAAGSCILWLWTTNAFMRHAYAVLDAWGFTEKTILTWTKPNIGLGNWLRNQTEHCILAIKGKPLIDKDVTANTSTILSGAKREHSRKPDEFYKLVEALCPGSKVELFSREDRDGWKHYGWEAGVFNNGA